MYQYQNSWVLGIDIELVLTVLGGIDTDRYCQYLINTCGKTWLYLLLLWVLINTLYQYQYLSILTIPIQTQNSWTILNTKYWYWYMPSLNALEYLHPNVYISIMTTSFELKVLVFTQIWKNWVLREFHPHAYDWFSKVLAKSVDLYTLCCLNLLLDSRSRKRMKTITGATPKLADQSPKLVVQILTPARNHNCWKK